MPFEKVLVANRGEIAIRAFRAGYELGARTVAVFPHEDRNSLHRLKADEAYEIGEPGHPVRAYLSVDEIIRAAKEGQIEIDTVKLHHADCTSVVNTLSQLFSRVSLGQGYTQVVQGAAPGQQFQRAVVALDGQGL